MTDRSSSQHSATGVPRFISFLRSLMTDTEPTSDMTSDVEQQGERSQIDALRDELAQAQDRYVRLLADHENTKRHHERTLRELREYAAEHMITRMLPVLDDLHSAVEHSRTGADAEALRTGIEMIYTKAVRIFEDAGLSPIDVEPGHPFNVDLHEALMHTPSDVPEGHIVQVIQRGYQLRDKVIRHSKVVTSAGLLPPTE
ncbi:MAG: nucleotide exchange factor GrpE [Candidatus Kapabacteria bacterium]|nr:nucleotide exchange factor GrpE [Candidatus Kapabacteria bacterium]